MSKIKNSFSKLGILIFSFMLIACSSEQKIAENAYAEAQFNQSTSSVVKVAKVEDIEAQINRSASSEQKSKVKQKVAKQEIAKTQTDDSFSSVVKATENEEPETELKIDWSEIEEEEDSWYGEVSNWFGGLFSDELEEAAENGDAKAQFKLGEKYYNKKNYEKAL